MVVHCVRERQAHEVPAAVDAPWSGSRRSYIADQIWIAYCQDGRRLGSHGRASFTSPRASVPQRAAPNKHGQRFTAFLPAISKQP